MKLKFHADIYRVKALSVLLSGNNDEESSLFVACSRSLLHELPFAVESENLRKYKHEIKGEEALGCVNSASWLPLPAGRKFTQPSHFSCVSVKSCPCDNHQERFVCIQGDTSGCSHTHDLGLVWLLHRP